MQDASQVLLGSLFHSELRTESRARECRHNRVACRDQHPVHFASRAASRPCPPLDGRLVPLLKPPARHEFALCRAAGAAGFRLRFSDGRCSSAAFR